MLSEPLSSPSILEFLPPSIRAVVEVAIAEFLEIESSDSNVPPPDSFNGKAQMVLDLISPDLRTALSEYAHEIEMPSEFVVELAIAHFLDPDSMTYEDCQVGVGRSQIERLKQRREPATTQAA
jgi:hypothetical protein